MQYTEIWKMIRLKHEQNEFANYLENVKGFVFVFFKCPNYDHRVNNTHKYIKDKQTKYKNSINKKQLNQLLTICHLTLPA